MAAVTRRWVRPTSRTAESVPRTAGITSASQQIRRMVEAVSCSPVSVVAVPGLVAQVGEVHGDGDPWGGAVGVGEQVGGLEPAAGLDQGVEHPGAVVAGVAAVVAAAGDGAGVRGRRPGRWLGWGAASGIRVALIRAASSVLQRPLIQAPPAWSSVMVRCRRRWAARSSRSSSRSVAAVLLRRGPAR